MSAKGPLREDTGQLEVSLRADLWKKSVHIVHMCIHIHTTQHTLLNPKSQYSSVYAYTFFIKHSFTWETIL